MPARSLVVALPLHINGLVGALVPISALAAIACGGTGGATSAVEGSEASSASEGGAEASEASADGEVEGEADAGEGTETGGAELEQCVPDPAWSRLELVDARGVALVADAEGGVHLLLHLPDDRLVHQRWQDGALSEAELVYEGVAGAPLMGADANGGLHGIVPLTITSEATVYLQRDSAGVWTSESVAEAYRGVDLAVDAELNVHFVRGPDFGQGETIYRRRLADGSWPPEFVFESGEAYPGIALLGELPFVCFSSSQGFKRCALGDGSGSFPEPTEIGEFANFMAMDDAGGRAYLYLNRLHNGTTWEAGLTIHDGTSVVAREIIESSQGIGIGHMLGDTTFGGEAHAAYVLFVNGASGELGLRHARRTDTGWDASWAACELGTEQPLIAASDAGSVHLVYRHTIEGVGARFFLASRVD